MINVRVTCHLTGGDWMIQNTAEADQRTDLLHNILHTGGGSEYSRFLDHGISAAAVKVVYMRVTGRGLTPRMPLYVTSVFSSLNWQ